MCCKQYTNLFYKSYKFSYLNFVSADQYTNIEEFKLKFHKFEQKNILK